MNTQNLTIEGTAVALPAYYQRVDSMPDDPENSVPYMAQTEHALCFVLVYPVSREQALPRDKDMLISGIREYLSDKQGIIQVETGEDYVYSIVKTLHQPSGVQYTLTYQKFSPQGILAMHGFFEENGATGMRDSVVFEQCRGDGAVGNESDPFFGWAKDPYDPEYTKGVLMNISEQEQYDERFPDFPLSLCRELVVSLLAGGT